MKKYILSLFDPAHRWLTLAFLIIAIIMTAVAFQRPDGDKIRNILLWCGMPFFFMALGPWRNLEKYIILSLISTGVIVLIIIIVGLSSGEIGGFAEASLFLVFVYILPGFVFSTILGVVINSFLKK